MDLQEQYRQSGNWGHARTVELEYYLNSVQSQYMRQALAQNSLRGGLGNYGQALGDVPSRTSSPDPLGDLDRVATYGRTIDRLRAEIKAWHGDLRL